MSFHTITNIARQRQTELPALQLVLSGCGGHRTPGFGLDASRRFASWQNAAMDPGYCIDVPPGFDDSGEDAQVHPMARRLFCARTAAEVFAKGCRIAGLRATLLVLTVFTGRMQHRQPVALRGETAVPVRPGVVKPQFH